MTVAGRIAARTERRGPAECWPWRGEVDRRTGYPILRDKTRELGTEYLRPHHLAYRSRNPETTAEFFDHVCDNRRCLNPAHIVPRPQRTKTAKKCKALYAWADLRLTKSPLDPARTRGARFLRWQGTPWPTIAEEMDCTVEEAMLAVLGVVLP